jgi:hypothetical protein
MPKVRAAFLSYFPGGMQAAPEWSSDSGLAASALLERELTARFVGGALITTATGRTMKASAADMLAAIALIPRRALALWRRRARRARRGARQGLDVVHRRQRAALAERRVRLGDFVTVTVMVLPHSVRGFCHTAPHSVTCSVAL